MESNRNITKLSQNLRTNGTKEENTLWYQYLRRYPVQFRRQCPFGKYIVDFYCAKALLVVELDGSQHYDPKIMEQDAVRSAYLESLGILVLRFSNKDINENLSGVCHAIDQAVNQRMDVTGIGRKHYTTLKNRKV